MAEPTAADVQEELQEYLNSKNINALFIQIVERLLIEKPDNPIAFIIEYLQKTYPDQATSVALPQTLTQDRDRDRGLSSDEEDEEDEEDPAEEEAPKELPVIQPAKPPAVKRRTSVSAESLDPAKAKAEVRKIPKNEEESARILNILRHNKFLAHLDDKQIKILEEAFAPLEKKAGDYIIKQGDFGDNWYVLDNGSVEVYKKMADGNDQKVHQYAPGDSFGELALMYNAPRAATCKAATDCKLWALDRLSFKTIIMQAAIGKRQLYKDFLQRVEILKQLDEYEILTMADCLQEESFNDGDIIFKQGEPGDTFYMVKEGSATCLQKDANGKDVEVAHLTAGMYFGEVALLTSKKRQATVKAGPGLKLLSLDRQTFKRVLGPIEHILHRNMEVYSQIMGSKA